MRSTLIPFPSSFFGLGTLAVLAGASHSTPERLAHLDLARRCTGTISSLDDVAAAIKCTTVNFSCPHAAFADLAAQVNIESFTVPDGKTFELELLEGTTVNVCSFTLSDWYFLPPC